MILEENPNDSFYNNNVEITNGHFADQSTSVDVSSASVSMVVTSQSNFPGWKAYVDGVETHLYRADYDFMAILVPSGNHHVEVRYEPESFKWGLIGGGISLAIVLLSWVYLRKK